MRAGQKRDLIRFERKGSQGGGYVSGGGEWSELITVAAEIENNGGSEKVFADRLAGVTGFEIAVRECAALSDLSTADRAVNARTGAVYDLRHIDRETGRADLIITADTGTPSNGG